MSGRAAASTLGAGPCAVQTPFRQRLELAHSYMLLQASPSPLVTRQTPVLVSEPSGTQLPSAQVFCSESRWQG